MKNQKSNTVIHLDDRFCILVLPLDYALATRRVDKSGRERRDTVGFFGSVERCLTEYTKQTVHDELTAKGDCSLGEAVEAIHQATERCTALIRECFPQYRVVS